MFRSAFRPRIGDVLVELGVIDGTQLALALGRQRGTGERLGEALLRIGFIDRLQLSAALAEQYRRWLAGAVGVAMLALQGGPAAAGSTGTLHLVGVVPPRSAIRLVESAPTPAFGGAVQNAPLARLLDEGNGAPYSVRVQSDSARAHGQPMLVAGDKSAPIPYSIMQGDREIRFDRGQALLKSVAGGRQSAVQPPTDLRISLGHAAPAARAGYADTLRFVIRAN